MSVILNSNRFIKLLCIGFILSFRQLITIFKETEINQISNWICDIVLDINNEKLIREVKEEVIELCKEFPVYK